MNFKSFIYTFTLLTLSIVALLLQLSIIPFAIIPIMITAASILTGLFIYHAVISTFLLAAARSGNVTLTKMFIALGANINWFDKDGYTPLHFAASHGDNAIAVALIEKGANVNYTNTFGQTPLHYAALKGNTETVLTLLEKCANINAKSNDGLTPLHQAAINGHTAIAEALITAGAEKDAKDEEGCAPLHLAAENGHTEIVKTLLKVGANIHALSRDHILFPDSSFRKNPLDLAIKGEHAETILVLIQASKSKHEQNLTKLRDHQMSFKHKLTPSFEDFMFMDWGCRHDLFNNSGLRSTDGFPYAELKVLNIKATYEISINEINIAYKKAALKAHPDKQGGTSESFQNVNSARDTLLKLCSGENDITEKIEQEEKLLNKVQEQDCSSGKWQKIADENKEITASLDSNITSLDKSITSLDKRTPDFDKSTKEALVVLKMDVIQLKQKFKSFKEGSKKIEDTPECLQYKVNNLQIKLEHLQKKVKPAQASELGTQMKMPANISEYTESSDHRGPKLTT